MMTDIITIQQHGRPAHFVQALVDGIGDRTFSASAQSGKPDHTPALSKIVLAPLARNGMVVPDNFCGFVAMSSQNLNSSRGVMHSLTRSVEWMPEG